MINFRIGSSAIIDFALVSIPFKIESLDFLFTVGLSYSLFLTLPHIHSFIEKKKLFTRFCLLLSLVLANAKSKRLSRSFFKK